MDDEEIMLNTGSITRIWMMIWSDLITSNQPFCLWRSRRAVYTVSEVAGRPKTPRERNTCHLQNWEYQTTPRLVKWKTSHCVTQKRECASPIPKFQRDIWKFHQYEYTMNNGLFRPIGVSEHLSTTLITASFLKFFRQVSSNSAEL